MPATPGKLERRRGKGEQRGNSSWLVTMLHIFKDNIPKRRLITLKHSVALACSKDFPNALFAGGTHTVL